MNCIFGGNRADGGDGGGLAIDGEGVVADCTISGNLADSSGGGLLLDSSNATVVNCIVWDNEAASGDQIAVVGGSPVISYCDVEGGWPGQGNIDADPLFVDPDNADYHLSVGSPCIDAGCNWGVPVDTADLDEDGDTSEFTPLDLDGEGRFFDEAGTPDTGCGCPPIVDMGGYESGGSGPQPCPGDLDCDRVVGHSDLGTLLGAWEWSDEGDLNCDGETDHADLGILLAHWGEGCP